MKLVFHGNDGGSNVDELLVIIEQNNYVNIIPTCSYGRYIECCREWLETDRLNYWTEGK